MGRLKFVVNVGELTSEENKNLGEFRGIKRSEWNRIRQIVYYSKEELHCAICLETSFRVPQMTSCGHVFCWHCIVMHFYKCKISWTKRLRLAFAPSAIKATSYNLSSAASLSTQKHSGSRTKLLFSSKLDEKAIIESMILRLLRRT